MRKSIFVIIALIFTCVSFSQVKEINSKLKDAYFDKLSGVNKIYSLKSETFPQRNFQPVKKTIPEKEKEKSPGLAFIYSLFVPGTGQLYAKRLDVGKYYMISEASLWLGYAAFSIYGNWLLNDAYNYAAVHAGISNDGKEKDDQFYIDIANYSNYEQYNNERLIFGQYDKLYYPDKGYYFYWDNEVNRRKYREDKLAGDRIKNDRLFIVGAILVNHVVSAISAIVLTNNYNSDLKKSTGGFSLNADVIKFGSRVDGVKLKLVKWF